MGFTALVAAAAGAAMVKAARAADEAMKWRRCMSFSPVPGVSIFGGSDECFGKEPKPFVGVTSYSADVPIGFRTGASGFPLNAISGRLLMRCFPAASMKTHLWS
jgi:hypothetical protein